jgi:hypothetical protein
MGEYILESEYLAPEESGTSARLRYGFICKHEDILYCPIILTDAYPKTRAKRRVFHVRIKSD